MPPKPGTRRDPAYVRAQLNAGKKGVNLGITEKEWAEGKRPEGKTAMEIAMEKAMETTVADKIEAAINDALAAEGVDVSELKGDSNQAFRKAMAESVARDDAPTATETQTEPKAAKTPKVAKRETADHCRICGKYISNPKSITRGIGPICWTRIVKTQAWDEAVAKTHITEDTDEAWTKLIAEMRELFAVEDRAITEIPEGYVTMSSFCREAERRGLTASRAVAACGGDRAVGPILDERFATVYVQVENRTRKYLHPSVMTDESFAMIKGAIKPRVLAGAAKAAREAAEAKKTAGSDQPVTEAPVDPEDQDDSEEEGEEDSDA